jgi:hypothetical protein
MIGPERAQAFESRKIAKRQPATLAARILKIKRLFAVLALKELHDYI